MTRQEFKRLIIRSRKYVKQCNDGICCSLDEANYDVIGQLDGPVSSLFHDMMHIDSNLGYWLGRRNETNLIHRLIYLKTFEKIVLDTKLYKEL